MWDVWASYEPTATGLFVNEERTSESLEIDRATAMSFASHRLLTIRYADSVGSPESLAEFDQVLKDLCLDPAAESDELGAASFGRSVADRILAETLDDGSLEADGYRDPSYLPVNDPLIVNQPGAVMANPNRWQPLSLAEQITQNGQVIPDEVQDYIGPNWGFVTPFAIEPDPVNGLPVDPGPPPMFGVDDDEFIAAASQVVLYSSLLDFTDDTRVDISPAALGNTPLGTYEPAGWETNPDTGAAYEPNLVLEVDFARVIAEYWADGPDSETPPGHWNTLANEVGDELEAIGELTIDGQPVDRLEWDVKIGIAMNGALHDAAVPQASATSTSPNLWVNRLCTHGGGSPHSRSPKWPAWFGSAPLTGCPINGPVSCHQPSPPTSAATAHSVELLQKSSPSSLAQSFSQGACTRTRSNQAASFTKADPTKPCNFNGRLTATPPTKRDYLDSTAASTFGQTTWQDERSVLRSDSQRSNEPASFSAINRFHPHNYLRQTVVE